MKTKWLILLISLLLFACGQGPGQSTATPEPPSPADLEQPTQNAAAEVTETQGTEPATGQGETVPAEGCTVQTLLAPPSATEVSRFPPVGADEWQAGPTDAVTTIVEYGDFQ